MTPRERLLTVLQGGIPDCVPVCPDFSNMIPARMTGKPFWDIYLYHSPCHGDAYIECAKHFDIDSLMDGFFPLQFPEEVDPEAEGWEKQIVQRTEDRIVTQESRVENGKREWAKTVNVYHIADSPVWDVAPHKVGLPSVPQSWEPVEGGESLDRSPEGLRRQKELLGDQGLVGVFATGTCVLTNEDDVYDYYDMEEDERAQIAEDRLEKARLRMDRILALPEEYRPDFICVGGSGSLVLQTVEILRELALPAVKHVIERATEAGLPTHIHCCGPEAKLVKIMAEETTLSVIDPLEIPPMGDCNLAELKAQFGDKLILKGNLHTTDVMLRGSVKDVRRAARQAIDDAATGGRFILSTGDQCGRDTPDDNLHAMVEIARTYGRYNPDGTVVGAG